MNQITLLVSKVLQDGQNPFYIGQINPKDLLKICRLNPRDLDDTGKNINIGLLGTAEELLDGSNNSGEIEDDSNEGTQREISLGRLKNVWEYINIDIHSMFPNNIIIGFDKEYVNIKRVASQFSDLSGNILQTNEEFFLLELSMDYKSAFIIDGQHRLFGFLGGIIEEKRKQLAKDKSCNISDIKMSEIEISNSDIDDAFLRNKFFNVGMSCFIGLPKIVEANIFKTINSTPQKIDTSLYIDLTQLNDYEISYDKIGNDIIRVMNSIDLSPWKGRIDMLGSSRDPLASISQNRFYVELKKLLDSKIPEFQILKNIKGKKQIKELYSYNPALREKYDSINLSYNPDEKVSIPNIYDKTHKYLFYKPEDLNNIEDIKEDVIVFLIRYFEVIKSVYFGAWYNTTDYILTKSIGFAVFMRLATEVFYVKYDGLRDESNLNSLKTDIKNILDNGYDFSSEKFNKYSSGSGHTSLTREIIEKCSL